MATKYLSLSANLSLAVWWTTSGGVTPTTAPGVGDDADLNGKTLTVDQALTCDNITNGTGTGVLAVSGSQTITANATGAVVWSCTLNSASQTVTWVGNITAGNATRITVNGASTTLNVTGNVTGSAGTSSARGISCASGTVTITGNCQGGGAAIAHGANSAGGAVTVTGNATGGSSTACGVASSIGSAAVSITGTVTGGTGTGSYGAQILSGSTSTLTITGSLVDSATCSAVANQGGTFTYTPTNAQTATIGGKVLYPWKAGARVLASSIIGAAA